MIELLWTVPALPFAGFLCLALVGGRLSRRVTAWIGVGSIGLSAVATLIVGARFLSAPPADGHYAQSLWTWMEVAGFRASITLYLDPLSLVFAAVVTVVGFLIHLYSAEFMLEEEGYSRYFAYMNLFVGSMLLLVLADNLLLLYVGWEGVGMCSYLLIGFWYRDGANGRAARKAFIVTRVGDTAMAIGLFLILSSLGTLQIQELMDRASVQWPVGSAPAVAAAALLLGGALGKSAQLPLQTWLPDAMAGPTPVSALIHAATMVTAGVYLIARTNVLFSLAPEVQSAVAVIGALTLLLAGFSALTQWDIKRVLAYSTISQIGYMFLALGVGAWSAAVFHFMTHAFFKALLFLGAGVVILALDHEHSLHEMGGLRRQLPVTFWTFVVGAGALAAMPLVTAGFYSKDLILWRVFSSDLGGPWLWAAGLAGAFITSIYIFRVVFMVFGGPARESVDRRPGIRMRLPLIVLAVLSVIGGFVELPHTLGDLPLLSRFLEGALPSAAAAAADSSDELILQLLSAAIALAGVSVAYLLYILRPLVDHVSQMSLARALQQLWFSGWGFDRVYDALFVRPFVWAARINRDDFIDLLSHGTSRIGQISFTALSRTQSGLVRWYAMGVAAGALVVVGLVVFA